MGWRSVIGTLILIGCCAAILLAVSPILGQPAEPGNGNANASRAETPDAQPQTVPGRQSAFDAVPVDFKRIDRTRIGPRLVATLPNGLRVIVQQMPDTDVVAVRCFVGVGSMLEGDNLGCGISHFCEHLLAGGSTTTRTEDEIGTILDNIGGQSNAYTTVDHTCYYITTTAPYAETAVDLLGDWMQNCRIEPREFDREKNVIIREVEKGRTEPNRVFHRLFTETAFRVHPYRVPVIGYPDLVRAVSREQMVAFRDFHYHPANAVVAIAGGVDVRDALVAVNAHWGRWTRKPYPPLTLPAEPEQMAPRTVAEPSHLLTGDVAYVRISWPTTSLYDSRMYGLDLLASILGQGEGSRLVQRLRDEQKLVKSISCSSWTPTWGRGMFSITAATSYDKLGAARDAMLRELARCRDELVTQRELQRAITRTLSGQVYGHERAEDIAASIGFDLLALDDPDFDDKYLARVQTVTAEEIRSAAQHFFDPHRQTVVAMFAETAFSADADGDPWKSPDAEKPAISEAVAPAASAPAVRRFELPNGLRVLLKPMPGTRNVSFAAYGMGGVRYETPDTNGLFYAASRLAVRGTKSATAAQITEIFDSIGGAVSGSSGNNTYGLAARWIAGDGHLDAALKAIAEIAISPTFPEDEVATFLDRQRFAAQRQDESWQTETVRRLREDMFGAHPYHMPGIGTPESLATITREKIAECHATFCRPNNLVVALAGDFDVAEAEQLVRGLFGEWQRGDIPPDPAPAFVPPTEPKARDFTTAKDMTAIALGYTAPGFLDADRVVLEVIDAVTSGISIPSGWLHEALRGGTNDFVYYIHGLAFSGLDCGMFYVLTQCHPSQREEVLAIIRREMAKIWSREVTAEELESAKRMCRISHAVDFQTTGDWAGDIALNELYGLGWDYSQHYLARLDAVTAADVMRVAKAYFTAEVLVQAIPANPAGSDAAPREGE